LTQNNIGAQFTPPQEIGSLSWKERVGVRSNQAQITIKNDSKLVNRICAVVMNITINQSPQFIKDRLDSSDIRSLNNLIDITNYVMRVTGHPTHVFDY